MRHDVAALDELEHGRFLMVSLEGQPIGVTRWGDEVFAVRNLCPHVGGPVCGTVRAHLTATADPWSPEADNDRPVVVCAWHKWEFDLRTRESTTSSRMRVITYPVEVDADGRVHVVIPERRRAPQAPSPSVRTTVD